MCIRDRPTTGNDIGLISNYESCYKTYLTENYVGFMGDAIYHLKYANNHNVLPKKKTVSKYGSCVINESHRKHVPTQIIKIS